MARGSRVPVIVAASTWVCVLAEGPPGDACRCRPWEGIGDGGAVRAGRRTGCGQGIGDRLRPNARAEQAPGERGADVLDDVPVACGDARLAGRAGGDDRGDRVDLDLLEGRVLLPGGGTGGLAAQCRAHEGGAAAQDRRQGRRVDRPVAGVRVQLMGDRTREAIRLELLLEDASIKLSAVASSLTTVSARAMLAAMIAGERDPLALANLAKGRMRSKMPELAQALTGHFEAHHAQLARSILHRLDLVEQALRETDQAIAAACAPWTHQIELLQTIPGVGER